eukprot:13971079-Heterocapsa_arctica.AAC.1
MKEFCQSACGAYQEDINRLPGAQQLRVQKADIPYTTEDTTGDDDEPAGVLQGVCASRLMRLLFAARVARPDIQTAIVRLAKHITKWR